VTRMEWVINWLEGKQHEARKGHWPDWLVLGDGMFGRRQCINCLKGGHRAPRMPRLALVPRPMGL
jgi:hypothetical protein